ncbi:MAG: hypothetical protein GX989_05070 [Firmicutes bacterium]|nr:hypothetical protein [Bacillota bacterium]
MDDVAVINDYQLAQYFQELSADSLYPSAGSSAALTAAHAAALFAMACRVNLRKIEEKSSESKNNKGRKTFWQDLLHRATLLLEQSLVLAQADGFAIKDYVEGAPRGAEKATKIPLNIARCAMEIAALTRRAFPDSYAPVQADVECASCLAEGSKEAALIVARYNLPLLSPGKQDDFAQQISACEKDGNKPLTS